MGIIHKVSPAINRFHCVLVALLNMKRFTVSGLSSLSPMRILGSRKSFQDHIKTYTNGNRCWFNKWKYDLRHNSKNSTSIYCGCFFQLPRYIFQKSRKRQNSKRTEESNIKNDNSSKGIGKIGICSKYRNRNHNCMKRHDLSENKIQIQIL